MPKWDERRSRIGKSNMKRKKKNLKVEHKWYEFSKYDVMAMMVRNAMPTNIQKVDASRRSTQALPIFRSTLKQRNNPLENGIMHKEERGIG